ncbi:MAG: TrkA family potassium uptake protein [Anaerolineae bacterium]|nr:TrkA family potassium uptake protein [Anaerolineae bacterium]
MKFIVIGCGRIGATLARTLALRGHLVTVVDRDPAAFERLGVSFKGHTVVGVAFDRDTLIEAGIERTDGVALTTASDEANITAGRLALQVFQVPRVVARVYDPRKAEIYKRLGLQTVSLVTWGVNRIADLMCHSDLEVVYSVGGGQVDVVMVEASPLLAGRTVRDLTVSGELVVIAITRGGDTFLPTLGAVLQVGDELHLAVLATAKERARTLLGLP